MNSTATGKKNIKSNNSFSVLNLNLRFGLANDGPNGWEHRKKCFHSLLKDFRADFIGFQEVNNFQSDFLKELLFEYNCIGERKPAPSFWQNNIIFYNKNWECVYHDHFYLSPTPKIPSRYRKSLWPRQCTIGVFKSIDCKMICANTHFDFDTFVQTQSATLIMQRLADIASDIPVILIGDFNATPNSPCYEIFTGNKAKDIQGKGDFFKNAFPKPFPSTFHGFNDDKKGNHIDWILYRGRLTPNESRIIHGKINGMYPSDHFPLFAVFNKRKNEEK